MPLERAGQLADLPPGSMLEIQAAGRQIVVCNVNGELHAMDGVCPHRGGPLAQGGLHGNMVVCPWHAWEFDCTTGVNDYNSSIRLDRYPVRVDNGDILIELP